MKNGCNLGISPAPVVWGPAGHSATAGESWSNKNQQWRPAAVVTSECYKNSIGYKQIQLETENLTEYILFLIIGPHSSHRINT